MHNWNAVHGWMDALDEDFGLTRAFTIGYRFTDDRADPWTCRFNRFKAQKRGALRGGAAVMRYAVPGLVSGLGLDASKTVFVPALSSGETVASDKGVLWRVTKYCAQFAGAGFAGDAITKKALVRLLHRYEAGFKSDRIGANNILIFDDSITRGSTISHIALAILDSNRRVTIYGVALGKTERRSYHRRFDVELSNAHVPQRWDRIWRKGEAG